MINLFLDRSGHLNLLSLMVGQEILVDDPGSIIEPEPIRFSFDTPGWYALFFLLAVLLIYLLFRWIRNYRQNKYRRTALKRIDNLAPDHLTELMVILRITAIQAYGRENIAPLSGKDWFTFLDSKVKQPLFGPYGALLMEFLYREKFPGPEHAQNIFANAQKWIKHHVA